MATLVKAQVLEREDGLRVEWDLREGFNSLFRVDCHQDVGCGISEKALILYSGLIVTKIVGSDLISISHVDLAQPVGSVLL